MLCRNEIQEVVTADLRKLLGVEGQPTFMRYGEYLLQSWFYVFS